VKATDQMTVNVTEIGLFVWSLSKPKALYNCLNKQSAYMYNGQMTIEHVTDWILQHNMAHCIIPYQSSDKE
jgi:hypothetical protein